MKENIRVDVPAELKESFKKKNLTEAEAYQEVQRINQSGEYDARVENNTLKVQKVLRG